MAKPKAINPCVMKGRYFGHRATGRRYNVPSTHSPVIPSGCECSSSFLNFCDQEKSYLIPKSNYALDKKSMKPETDFIELPVIQPCSSLNNSIMVVPCEKSFLNLDSEGTKAFRNLKNRQNIPTKFKGCYSVDEDLLNDKFINYDLKESLGLYNDILGSLDIQDYNEEIRDSNWNAVLTKFSRADSITGVNSLNSLWKMLEQFDKNESIGHGMTSPDAETIISEKDQPSAESTLKLKKLKIAFKKMTKLQRLAVRAVYFKNFDNKTKGEIAKSLGITLDTLKDRLTLAFAKIIEEFRDMFPKYDEKTEREKTKKWRPKRRIIVPKPIYLKKGTHSTVVITPTESNLRPLGELRERPGIKVELIKRRIRAHYLGIL